MKIQKHLRILEQRFDPNTPPNIGATFRPQFHPDQCPTQGVQSESGSPGQAQACNSDHGRGSGGNSTAK